LALRLLTKVMLRPRHKEGLRPLIAHSSLQHRSLILVEPSLVAQPSINVATNIAIAIARLLILIVLLLLLLLLQSVVHAGVVLFVRNN
jgi:hypothetical protein